VGGPAILHIFAVGFEHTVEATFGLRKILAVRALDCSVEVI
jgi:hypothetical protein